VFPPLFSTLITLKVVPRRIIVSTGAVNIKNAPTAEPYYSRGVNTPPLGAVKPEGAGYLFPRMRKDFSLKSSIPRRLRRGGKEFDTKRSGGNYNPTLEFLNKMTRAIGKELEIRIV
jgi:hypothetical protein